MSIIPARQEAEVAGLQSQASSKERARDLTGIIN
jgi:hypothetical protein